MCVVYTNVRVAMRVRVFKNVNSLYDVQILFFSRSFWNTVVIIYNYNDVGYISGDHASSYPKVRYRYTSIFC